MKATLNPMKVNVQYAETHLADLIIAASNGEEVEIELPNKPALFLAPRPGASHSAPPKRSRADLLGAWEGKVVLPTDDEWRAMDQEIEAEMLNGPIFPAEHT